MNVTSIKFRGHRCFKKEWAGFDQLKPVTVIIGRNNTGKSHLLDLVQALCEKKAHVSKKWDLRISGQLTEEKLRTVFPPHLSGGNLPGGNHWDWHGKHFVGMDFSAEYNPDGPLLDFNPKDGVALISGIGGHLSQQAKEEIMQNRLGHLKTVVLMPTLPLNDRVFRRLSAERNIKAEMEAASLALGSDGHGATNIIRRYLNTSNSAFPRELIQTDMLRALNDVFGPDGHFTEIKASHHDQPTEPDQSNGHWEIYLGEKEKRIDCFKQIRKRIEDGSFGAVKFARRSFLRK